MKIRDIESPYCQEELKKIKWIGNANMGISPHIGRF